MTRRLQPMVRVLAASVVCGWLLAAATPALAQAPAAKASHTIRYSAAPPEGFVTTDTIMAISLVAKMSRK